MYGVSICPVVNEVSHTQQFGLSVGTGERCSQSSRVEAEKERLNDECDQKERLNDK